MNPNAEDLSELAEIIAAFDASTSRLKASHDELQERVAELTGELSRKNEELSATLAEVSALKNYLANILESITDGVLAIDLEHKVVALNQAAAEAIPDLAAEREGRPVAVVLPESCQELGRLLVKALREERRLTNVEVELPGAAGTRRILSVAVSPIRSEQGAVLGAVQTFRDLTEMKNLELRAARKDRLAALGEMAAGVAHEIRNPLGGITLYASLLQRSLAEDSKEAGLIRKVIAAAASLNHVVEDMLTFTRGREPVRKAVAVEGICRAALELAATALEEKQITVQQQYDTAGAVVRLDPELLSRAFLNVILNAAQAMAPGKTLTITARFEEAAGKGHARELVVAFADEGPGVPAEVADMIFNPFFTARDGGTGLGLAIVHKVAQEHGGSIALSQNRPQGAVFTFRLPALEEV